MTTVTLQAIPSGPAGIRATLRKMRRLIKKYKTAPAIRAISQKIVQSVPEKNYSAEAKAIFKFVQSKVRYTRDIHGVETLQTPIQTLKMMSGDCDDQVTLCGAMLQSVGHPVRLIACGHFPKRFTHVFLETRIGNKWYALECTERGWSFGRRPDMKYIMVEHV